MSDPRRAAITRFTGASAAEPLITAAFLGGSFASGTADDFSDLDLYLVIEEDDYERFFDQRNAFMRAWGEPVFLDTTRDFAGFGFDMLHFVFADGVSGELALGHRGNMLAMHGGAHEVLVDKAGVLDEVSFPLYEPSVDDRRRATERSLAWFWVDAIELAKYLARGRLSLAQSQLARMRTHCEVLAQAADGGDESVRDRLAATFVAADADEIAAAGAELAALHRHIGDGAAASAGLEYPAELAGVAEGHLRRATRVGPSSTESARGLDSRGG